MDADLAAEVDFEYPGPLSDPGEWLEPFDWYDRMRDEEPIRYDPERQMWDVFRYEDAIAVAKDVDRFSSDPRKSHMYDPSLGASPMRETMLSSDPPRHTRLREAVDDLFRPDAVADLEPAIRRRANELLDDLVAGGGGDFVSAFATPLPASTVAELLGIPGSDREQFAEWVSVVKTIHLYSDGGDVIAEKARAHYRETMEALTAYVREAILERREDPRDDLLTRVATARPGDERLDAREMLGFCMLMMFGGTVTTENLLANALWCLGDRPELLRAYEAGDGDVPGLVEETLRYRSPIQALSRFASEPTAFRGHDLDEGAIVSFWIGSANRDPEEFDAPAEFRPGRSPNRHVAFGSGSHYCIGAPLARLEAEVALTAVFDRLSGVEVDTEDLTPVRTHGKRIYGIQSLPVDFEAAE